jgi:hypothetical protein
MISSISEIKSFYKIQHPFMIQAPKKLGTEEIHFNIMKAMYDKPIANNEKPGSIFSKSRT